MIDRTHLIALFVAVRLRLAVLLFALSWMVRWYQVFGGGIEAWALIGWVGVWVVLKIWKVRKQRKEREDEA